MITARVTAESIWTTHVSAEECPECQGEGRTIEAIPGGTWNSYVGTWEPAERDTGDCEDCNATGEIAVERCDRCNHPTEDNHREILREHGECSCGEDTMLTWHESREAVA